MPWAFVRIVSALPPTVSEAVLIVVAEALLVAVGVGVPLPLPVEVLEPHAATKSARARLIARKRTFLECFMCWILLVDYLIVSLLQKMMRPAITARWQSATQKKDAVIIISPLAI